MRRPRLQKERATRRTDFAFFRGRSLIMRKTDGFISSTSLPDLVRGDYRQRDRRDWRLTWRWEKRLEEARAAVKTGMTGASSGGWSDEA